jgi:lysophospholipase L1-like esterase
MLDCLILGDSIAVGTHAVRKECAEHATGGLNSWQWNKKYKSADLTAKSVIISLGTNDHQYVKTRKELETMRARVKANKVYWILPVGNSPKSGVSLESIQATVTEVAKSHGDTIIPIAYVQKDGIHPSWRGYERIAEEAHL